MLARQERTDNLRQAYELAYQKACEEFRRWDPQDMARSAGGCFDQHTGAISLVYVNEEYSVNFPTGEVRLAGKCDPVATTVKIVLLHYLVRAGGQPLKHSWVSFKEIPHGGMVYLDAFNKRIINHFIAVFGGKPAMLVKAGELLGGTAVKCGDWGIKIDVLPRLPVTLALWTGDEEFPPRATVLYDATAPFYLPTEDLVEATSFSVRQLAKTAKKLVTG